MEQRTGVDKVTGEPPERVADEPTERVAGGPPGKTAGAPGERVAGELSEVDLLLRVARSWRRLGREHDHDLSPHQERALLALARLGRDTGVHVSRLAEHLGIAPRSATEVADALQTAELLTRSPDPTDRRAVLLTLTGAGLHTVERVRERRRTAAEQAVATLSPADRAELRRLLHLLLEERPGH